MNGMRQGVVTFGEAMGLFDANETGALRLGRKFSLSFGGSESNVAIGVVRLGGAATWMGMLGNDPIGDLIFRELRAEGVSVHAARHASAPTSIMLKEHPFAATSRVHYYRSEGAGSQVTLDDIDLDLVRNAAVFHVSGITAALSDRMADLTAEIMQIAREADVLVSLDLNYRAWLWDATEAREVYGRLLANADLVFGGELEASIATGLSTDPLSMAHSLTRLGPKDAVVTLGSQGAVAVIDDHEHIAPGVSIDAIDTVGAGDGFVAGYLAELMKGSPAEARLALGNAVGAHVCQIPGDWESLPSRRDLEPASDPVQR